MERAGRRKNGIKTKNADKIPRLNRAESKPGGHESKRPLQGEMPPT